MEFGLVLAVGWGLPIVQALALPAWLLWGRKSRATSSKRRRWIALVMWIGLTAGLWSLNTSIMFTYAYGQAHRVDGGSPSLADAVPHVLVMLVLLGAQGWLGLKLASWSGWRRS